MRKTDKCPEKYCFNWEEKGSKAARGFYASLAEGLSKLELVTESGCGLTLAICSRDQKRPNEGAKDYYEPHEPNLERDGIPEDFFRGAKS